MERKFLVLTCLIVAFTLMTYIEVKAETAGNVSFKTDDPIVHIDLKENCPFDQVFEKISHDFKVTLIFEGAPYVLTIGEEDSKSLIEEFHKGLPLQTAIEKLANAYDFEARRLDNSLFIFQKRYSRPDDFPFVTLEEATHAMNGIARASSGLMSDEAAGASVPYPVQFAASLSDEQKDALIKGIPISQLQPQQQKLLWAWNMATYVGTKRNLPAKIANQLKAMRNPKSVYRWMNLLGTGAMAFGCEGPFDPNSEMQEQIVLSHNFRANEEGANIIFLKPQSVFALSRVTDIPDDKAVVTRFAALLESNKVDGKLPDPTAPEPGKRYEIPELKQTLTLRQLTDRLNAENQDQSTPAKEKPLRFDVENYLAPKTVTLFPSWVAAPPNRILSAVAEIYGLQAVMRPKETLTLISPTVSPARDYEELGLQLQKILPLPWKRYFIGLRRHEEDALREEKTGEPLSAPAQEYRRRARKHQALLTVSDTLHTAAVRRLREIVEPKVEESENKRLPLPQSGDEALRLMALICVGDHLPSLQGWDKDSVPYCLTHFADTIVQGGIHPEEHAFGVLLKYKDKNGQWHYENNVTITHNSIN